MRFQANVDVRKKKKTNQLCRVGVHTEQEAADILSQKELDIQIQHDER